MRQSMCTNTHEVINTQVKCFLENYTKVALNVKFITSHCSFAFDFIRIFCCGMNSSRVRKYFILNISWIEAKYGAHIWNCSNTKTHCLHMLNNNSKRIKKNATKGIWIRNGILCRWWAFFLKFSFLPLFAFQLFYLSNHSQFTIQKKKQTSRFIVW